MAMLIKATNLLQLKSTLHSHPWTDIPSLSFKSTTLCSKVFLLSLVAFLPPFFAFPPPFDLAPHLCNLTQINAVVLAMANWISRHNFPEYPEKSITETNPLLFATKSLTCTHDKQMAVWPYMFV